MAFEQLARRMRARHRVVLVFAVPLAGLAVVQAVELAGSLLAVISG